MLVPLVETAHANTGAFAQESVAARSAPEGADRARTRHSNDRRSARDARDIRRDPAQRPKRAVACDYGPDAAKDSRQVRREIQAAGHREADGEAPIRPRSCSSTSVSRGRIDDRGAVARRISRRRHAEQAAVAQSPRHGARECRGDVEIDAKLDLAIRTAGYTGLSFANRQSATHTKQVRAAFAKAVGASAVAVVGIDEVGGRSAVVGSLVSLRERQRAASREHSGRTRSVARQAACARAVSRRRRSGARPQGAVLGRRRSYRRAKTPRHDRRAATDRSPDRRTLGRMAVRDGGPRYRWARAGIVLVALDGKCPIEPPAGQQCNDFYDTATPGLHRARRWRRVPAVSIYLFATHHSAPVVAPTAGGATVGFATRW